MEAKSVCTSQCGINQQESAVTLFLSCKPSQKKEKFEKSGEELFTMTLTEMEREAPAAKVHKYLPEDAVQQR